MKTEKKTRTRCECDFCDKKNWAPHHMRRHEERCTMNPKRLCGVCKNLLQQDQPDIETLKALLPDPADRWQLVSGDGESMRWLPEDFVQEVESAIIAALREAAGNCPICMLAAIRQKGIPAGIIRSFKVKDELGSIWADVTERELDSAYGEY